MPSNLYSCVCMSMSDEERSGEDMNHVQKEYFQYSTHFDTILLLRAVEDRMGCRGLVSVTKRFDHRLKLVLMREL